MAALPGTLENGAKLAANWVMGEVSAALNSTDDALKSRTQSHVSSIALANLIARIGDGTISGKIAKDVFAAMWAGEVTGDDAADQLIAAKGLKQISDTGALDKIIDEVLAANQKSVDEFRAGKEKAFNALIGQAMKATKGKANPTQVNELLKKRLGG